MTAPVNTENTALAYAIEDSLGVLPGSPTWYTVDFSQLTSWGAAYTRVERDTTTKDRQNRKGDTVDVDSAVTVASDLTMSRVRDFTEGFLFATFAGEGDRTVSAVTAASDRYTVESGNTLATGRLVYARGHNEAANNGVKRVTGGSATQVDVFEELTDESSPPANAVVTQCGHQAAAGDITMDSSGNLVSSSLDFTTLEITAGQMIKVGDSGTPHKFQNAANNHFARVKTIAANLLTLEKHGGTPVADDGTAPLGQVWQVDDTPSGNAFVDETADANSDTSADLDLFPSSEAANDYVAFGADAPFTKLIFDCAGGTAGVGGTVDWEYWNGLAWTALSGVTDNTTGFTAGTSDGQTVTWTQPQDWATTTLSTESSALYYVRAVITGTYSTNPVYDQVFIDTEIRILFGQYGRNVGVDDGSYLKRSFQFELAWENLASDGSDEYEYAEGNYCNEMTIAVDDSGKATCSFEFVGTDTDPPTGTRKTNAASPVEPNRVAVLNGSDEVARLRITQTDESGVQTDFDSCSITLRNNIRPIKVRGTLGAKYMSVGKLDVEFDARLLFQSSDPITAIRNNTTMTLEMIMRDDEDGAVAYDIPALTLNGGNRDLVRNDAVRIQLPGKAHKDPTLGTSIGVSLFPYAPDGD